MTKKKFESKMAEITQAIAAITAAVNQPQVAAEQYFSLRYALNMKIIEMVFGATISGDKIRFNKSLPTIAQLSSLGEVFSDFYHNIETPIMDKFLEAQAKENTVNGTGAVNISSCAPIPKFAKIKVKEVKGAILGSDKCVLPIKQNMFTPDQLLEIAALAEDLRAVVRRNTIIIVGGMTLAVAGAAVAGVCIYNHKKNKDDAVDTAIDAASDIADMDDPVEEDVPMVELGIAAPLVNPLAV